MLICIHSVIMEEKNPKLEKQNSFGRNANFYKSHFLIHPKEKEKIKSFSISFYNILYAHILIHRQYWMAMWQWWHTIQLWKYQPKQNYKDMWCGSPPEANKYWSQMTLSYLNIKHDLTKGEKEVWEICKCF